MERSHIDTHSNMHTYCIVIIRHPHAYMTDGKDYQFIVVVNNDNLKDIMSFKSIFVKTHPKPMIHKLFRFKVVIEKNDLPSTNVIETLHEKILKYFQKNNIDYILDSESMIKCTTSVPDSSILDILKETNKFDESNKPNISNETS